MMAEARLPVLSVVTAASAPPLSLGKASPTAANHRHRQAREDQAQRALSGIVDYREDFYYREAFSLVEREFLTSG
jgi:hypothetical protein